MSNRYGVSGLFVGGASFAVCFALGYVAYQELDLSEFPEGATQLFPMMLTCVGGLASIGLVFFNEQRSFERREEMPDNSSLWRTIGAICLLCCYVGLLDLTGFTITTYAFLSMLFAAVFQKRGIHWVVLVPSAVSFVATHTLVRLLAIPLPFGIEPFAAINSILLQGP
ncbi:MAG: tripartite tricarboxylate transporter TctB family protein [Pseudomonadota bacterium]